MAKNRIAAIDIGSHAVKVAVVTPTRHGYRVERVGSATPAADGGAGALAAAVRSAMAAASARGDKCVVALPRSKSVVRRLTDLPPGLDRASLRDIVRLQAESELPFEAGAAAYDYHNLTEGESGSSVELVAARKDDIEALLAPVREAGGKPVAVTPGASGLGALAVAQGLGSAPGVGVLVLDVGHSSTDAALVRDGVVAFTRSSPPGAAAFAEDADAATTRLAAETDRTLQSIQRDPLLATSLTGTPFASVWLCGGGAATALPGGAEGSPNSLAEALEAQLGLPVSAQIASGAVEDGAGLASIQGGWAVYAVAVGLAMEALSGGVSLDLMARAERQRHEQSDRTRVMLAYVAAAALLVAAFTFLGGQLSAREARKLQELDRRIAALGSSRKRAADKLSDMQAMTAMLERKHSVLDILRELTELLPNRQDIAITALDIGDDGKVSVSFEAKSADAMSSAVRSMGTSVWFRDVQPGQVTTAEKDGQPVQQFGVTLRLAEDADLLAARTSGAAAVAAATATKAANDNGDAGSEQVAGDGAGPGGRQGRRQGGRAGGGGSGRNGGSGRGDSGNSDGGSGRNGAGRAGGSGGGRKVYNTADGGTKVVEGGRVTLYSADGGVITEVDVDVEDGDDKEEAGSEEAEDRKSGSYVEAREDRESDEDAKNDEAEEKDRGDGDSKDDGDADTVRVRRVSADSDSDAR